MTTKKTTKENINIIILNIIAIKWRPTYYHKQTNMMWWWCDDNFIENNNKKKRGGGLSDKSVRRSINIHLLSLRVSTFTQTQ